MFLSTMADLTTTTSTPNQTPTPTTTTTTTPETDTETPPPHTKPTNHHHTKILSFTNGALKNHHQNHHHHLSTPSVVIYKECLKNHAASLGGHALDGCGEFMPSQTATATDPTSLKCAACGCHRNFHRREPEEGGGAATQIIEFQANPIPTPPRHRSPTNSVSPPPISSAYYPSSAPHMLLALSGGGLSGPSDNHNRPANTATTMTTTMTTPPVMGSNSNGGGGRKRFRTKFSQEQKEKMYSFSEKVGWKMQKKDEGIMEEFCNEIGIGRSVLKVWMHNNKHTFGKRDGNNSNDHHHHHLQSTNIISPNNNYGTTSHVPNGSSSSS